MLSIDILVGNLIEAKKKEKQMSLVRTSKTET